MARNPFCKLKTCVSLIGMPGSGKSTIGAKLAKRLNMAFLDTDHLIESAYGTRLQDIADALGKDNFLDAESLVIRSINVSRCALATGGSVVYREESMRHLAGLGPIIWVAAPLQTIVDRVAENPERGIARNADQCLEDIFKERYPLYRKYANFSVNTDELSPEDCADFLAAKLETTLTGG